MRTRERFCVEKTKDVFREGRLCDWQRHFSLRDSINFNWFRCRSTFWPHPQRQMQVFCESMQRTVIENFFSWSIASSKRNHLSSQRWIPNSAKCFREYRYPCHPRHTDLICSDEKFFVVALTQWTAILFAPGSSWIHHSAFTCFSGLINNWRLLNRIERMR